MSDPKTLRSQLIRLAHDNPDLRGELLPLLADKVAAPGAVTIGGVRYKWKRDTKSTGRGSIGTGPNHLRGWYLKDAEDHAIILIQHSHHIPPYWPQPDKQEWKVIMRFPALPEEVGKNQVDFTLKMRFPSKDGEEGIEDAMAAGVRAYTNLKIKRDAQMPPPATP